jgi:hypothetical protein
MVFRDDLEEPEERLEILSDIKDLLGPFGEVQRIEFDELDGGRWDTHEGAVTVLITMDSPASVASAVALLQGLVVGGSTIRLVQLDAADSAVQVGQAEKEPSTDMCTPETLSPANTSQWVVKIVYESAGDRF